MRRFVLSSIFLLTIATGYGQNPAEALKNSSQLEAMRTLQRITADSSLYTLDYTADYRLDAFLKAGIDSPAKLGKIAAMKLMKPFKALSISKSMDMGCSAFQTKNSDGEIIYARNFDYPHKKPALILLKCSPENGYKSIGMVTMAFLKSHSGSLDDGHSDISFVIAAPYMTMDGMNEKGFAVSVLALKSEAAKQTEKGKRKLMTSVAIRMMLDKAASVDEAIELMKKFNFCANSDAKGENSYSYHFLLSDASGKSVILEYIKVDGKWVMNIVDADHVTNFYLSEGWQQVTDGGLERYRKIEEKKKVVMEEKEAMATLQYVYNDGTGPHHSFTQWSVVYNLAKQTARICVLGNYTNEYTFKNVDSK